MSMFVQLLQARRLFDSIAARLDDATVSLSHGVLSIHAELAPGENEIRISKEGTQILVDWRRLADNRIRVLTDGGPSTFQYQLKSFPREDVDRIEVTGGQGNDLIVVSEKLAIPSVLIGAGGSDTLLGGAGNDTLR